jgi:hypothetical protein
MPRVAQIFSAPLCSKSKLMKFTEELGRIPKLALQNGAVFEDSGEL